MAFVAILCVMTVNAQSWNKKATEYANEMNNLGPIMEQQFSAAGINVKFTSFYDSTHNDLVLDLRFDKSIWKMFNAQGMKVAKQTTLEEYRTNYKNDPEFAQIIKEMKANGAKFRITYTCKDGGKIKSHDFTITPAEIMR